MEAEARWWIRSIDHFDSHFERVSLHKKDYVLKTEGGKKHWESQKGCQNIRKAQRKLSNREKQQTVSSPSLASWESKGKLKTQSQGKSKRHDNKLESLAAR
jgi:hypothetical protein